MPTLKQVEAFYWTATLGAFHRAAERLGLTQSTVSKRIKELEAQAKVPLFDRTARSAAVTMKGREVLLRCEQVLAANGALSGALGTDAPIAGRFRLGITELVAVTWLPKLITQIRGRFPGLVIDYQVNMHRYLQRQLHDRQLDLVIGPLSEPFAGFEQVWLADVVLDFMCSIQFAGPGDLVPLAELARFPLLAQTEASGTQVILMRTLASAGVEASNIVYSNSMHGSAELAAAGLGVACRPLASAPIHDFGSSRLPPGCPTSRMVRPIRHGSSTDLPPRSLRWRRSLVRSSALTHEAFRGLVSTVSSTSPTRL